MKPLMTSLEVRGFCIHLDEQIDDGWVKTVGSAGAPTGCHTLQVSESPAVNVSTRTIFDGLD
jgi:hypothetical protein